MVDWHTYISIGILPSSSLLGWRERLVSSHSFISNRSGHVLRQLVVRCQPFWPTEPPILKAKEKRENILDVITRSNWCQNVEIGGRFGAKLDENQWGRFEIFSLVECGCKLKWRSPLFWRIFDHQSLQSTNTHARNNVWETISSAIFALDLIDLRDDSSITFLWSFSSWETGNDQWSIPKAPWGIKKNSAHPSLKMSAERFKYFWNKFTFHFDLHWSQFSKRFAYSILNA